MCLSRQKTGIRIATILLAVTSGCVSMVHWNPVWHERTVEQQVARGEATTLDVETTAGSIEVTGTDAEDVSVIATVRAGAPTGEEAQELAEAVEIRIEPVGQILRIRAAKPPLTSGRSIHVSYVIAAPRKIDVRCNSGYGALAVSNIEGTVGGRSGNGSIRVQNVQGTTDMHSSYGSITCRNVNGQMVRLHSGNGSVAASDIQGSVDLESAYGAVTCERLREGDLRLRSGNGRVVVVDSVFGTCDARSSYGSVGGNDLVGESVRMESGNGSIEVTQVTAPALSLSSSYGRIEAQQVVTSTLTARSGNGNVNIDCARTAGPALKAEVTSSYGSIAFSAPPDFSGTVALGTDYGSIRTALPVTMTGEVTRKKMTGRIGYGNGSLHLKTSNGSVHLK